MYKQVIRFLSIIDNCNINNMRRMLLLTSLFLIFQFISHDLSASGFVGVAPGNQGNFFGANTGRQAASKNVFSDFFDKNSSSKNLETDKRNAEILQKLLPENNYIKKIASMLENEKFSKEQKMSALNRLYRYNTQESIELLNNLSFLRDEIFERNTLHNLRHTITIQNTKNLWVTPLISSVQKDIDSSEVESKLKFGYKSNKGLGSVLLGASFDIDNFLLGIAGGYITKNLEYQGDYSGDKDELSTFALAVYSNYNLLNKSNEGLFLDSAITCGLNKGIKKLHLEKIDNVDPGSYTGEYKNRFSSNLSAKVGYSFAAVQKKVLIQPSCAVTWGHISSTSLNLTSSYSDLKEIGKKIDSSYNLSLTPGVNLLFRNDLSGSDSIIANINLEYEGKPINEIGKIHSSLSEKIQEQLVSHNFDYLSNKTGHVKLSPALSFISKRYSATLKGNYKKEISSKLDSWGVSCNIGIFF